jgi:hypothetical protein
MAQPAHHHAPARAPLIGPTTRPAVSGSASATHRPRTVSAGHPLRGRHRKGHQHGLRHRGGVAVTPTTQAVVGVHPHLRPGVSAPSASPGASSRPGRSHPGGHGRALGRARTHPSSHVPTGGSHARRRGASTAPVRAPGPGSDHANSHGRSGGKPSVAPGHGPGHQGHAHQPPAQRGPPQPGPSQAGAPHQGAGPPGTVSGPPGQAKGGGSAGHSGKGK